jgi:hypothetical protein
MKNARINPDSHICIHVYPSFVTKWVLKIVDWRAFFILIALFQDKMQVVLMDKGAG